jgi:hypothetical protein
MCNLHYKKRLHNQKYFYRTEHTTRQKQETSKQNKTRKPQITLLLVFIEQYLSQLTSITF